MGFRPVKSVRSDERGFTILLAALLITISVSIGVFAAVMIQYSRLVEQQTRTQQLLSIRSREQIKVFLLENGGVQYLEVVNAGTLSSTVVGYLVKGQDGALRSYQITGQAGGWPGQWKYRTPMAIATGAASAPENYRLRVTMNTASLIAAGKMRSDAGDLRFAMADGTTLLEYWIENGVNTDNTTVWIKYPGLLNSGSNYTIYVYYGNPGAKDRGNPNVKFVPPGGTFYFRSDGHTVNGLTANRLENTQSSSEVYGGWEGGNTHISARWGIRAWRRTPAGAETEITAGVPTAVVERLRDLGEGEGHQEAGWTFPGANFFENDSLVIRVYFQKKLWNEENWGDWQEIATFSSPRLVLSTLRPSTWRVVYYTFLHNGHDQDGEPYYDVRFIFGRDYYNSRIENILFDTSSVITLSAGAEEKLSPPPAKAIFVSALEKKSFALEIAVSAGERLGVLTQLGNIFWAE